VEPVVLRLVPVVLSLLVLGGHFLRSGHVVLVALVVTLLALLAVRRAWAARAVQVVLVLGAVEWTMTLLSLVVQRRMMGEPVLRLALILVAVVLVTVASAVLFQTEPLRTRYRLGRARGTPAA
jgi:uncharacterized membrane protein